MNERKNAISVLIWAIYTLAVVTVLFGIAISLCKGMDGLPIPPFVGAAIFTVLWMTLFFLLSRGLYRFLLKKKEALVEEQSTPKLSTLEDEEAEGENGEFYEENRTTARRGTASLVASAVCIVLFAAFYIVQGVLTMSADTLDATSLENAWYESAKVVENGAIPQLVHGMSYLYLVLLNGLFTLLGNKVLVGAWLSIALYLAAALVLLFAVSRLSGRLCGVISFALLMLRPLWSDEWYSLTPDALFLLLWGVGLLSVSGALRTFVETGEKEGILPKMPFFWTGLLIGILGYFDVQGFLLLFPMALVLALETREETGLGNRALAFGLGLQGVVLSFLVVISLDAVMSGKEALSVLNAWATIYKPQSFSLTLVSISEMTIFAGSDAMQLAFSVLVLVSLFLYSFGIFGFWLQKHVERQMLWTWMTLSCGLMMCFGVTTQELDAMLLLLLSLAALAGAGMQSLIPYDAVVGERVMQHAKQGEEPEEDADVELITLRPQTVEGEGITRMQVEPASEPRASEAVERTVAPEPINDEPAPMKAEPTPAPKPVEYLENPLPLPKRHSPREFDYPISRIPSWDNYDFPVADDDDFDH